MSEAILQIVSERVRAEYEQTIKDETERRYAAVLAAIEGRATVEPTPEPPPPTEPEPPKRERKPRSDRGQPRLGRRPTILPAEEPAPDSGSVNENPPRIAEGMAAVGDAIGPENIGAVAELVTDPHEPAQEEREEMLAPEGDDWGPHNGEAIPCATCHHIEMVHGDGRSGGSDACMAVDCKCRHFVPPNPLGIDDVDPHAREGSDATA